MTLEGLLVLASALVGVGLWGALSQQSIVMLLMGIELMVNGAILAGTAFWAYAAGGNPEGQLLVIVAMLVMAVEMVLGFAVVVAVYRARQADTTEGLGTLKR